jgi:uncharacterized protein Yka (UPF0111/DUF47 family)
MAPLHTSGPEAGVMDLLDRSGRNVERATVLLRDVLGTWPERPDLVAELVACEHDGDRLAHDIIHRLHGGRGGRRGLDPLDGHRLATALDDIVDDAEEAADMLGIYRVEAPMEQALRLGDVLVAAGTQVSVVIRWKDIFEALEAAVDACEHVAHVLEGIELKRAR